MTQKYLKTQFYYREGFLYRFKYGRQNKPAGSICKKKGYRHIFCKGKRYKAARLIFLYHHGYLPVTVDHIDRNRQNDKIENLRAASFHENQWNKGKTPRKTTSRYKGVHWVENRNKWKAVISVNNYPKYLGYFEKEDDAGKAYNKAAKFHYKQFANLNNIKSKS